MENYKQDNYAISHTDNKADCFECVEDKQPLLMINEGRGHWYVQLCEQHLREAVNMHYAENTEQEREWIINKLMEGQE